MKTAKNRSDKIIRQKNLFMLVALLLVGFGFYFLTLVRMGEQSARGTHPAPAESSAKRSTP